MIVLGDPPYIVVAHAPVSSRVKESRRLRRQSLRHFYLLRLCPPQRLRTRLEGIVSKRRDARYRSGRSLAWLKIKNPAYER